MNIDEAIAVFFESSRECGGYAEVLRMNGLVATAVSDQEGSKGPELTLRTEEDFISHMEEIA